jgi:acyl-[acyl-carrier-protein]-phospholipid O-acyltransferase/long-chain-fatty-acid--[acyl-carrier-protein] ligase
MISLAAVEALAAELWPDVPSAVASAPDPRKGERLVLVTQQPDASRSEFQIYAKAHGASDLMIPTEIMIVPKLPLLGSGKVDQLGVTKLVRERVAEKPLAAE